MINKDVVESERFQKKLQEDEYFKRVYLEYSTNPTEINKNRLNDMYKRYEKQLMALAYLRKMIFFEAKKFDANIRKVNKSRTSIDSLLAEDFVLIDERAEDSLNIVFESELKEIFSDEKLYREILLMTDKQKEVLRGVYVSELTEAVLAQRLGVSQQAVSKTHRAIIKKLRKAVE